MRKTQLRKDAVECLMMMFREMATKSKNADRLYVEKSRFKEMLYKEFAMTDDSLNERVFTAFDADRDQCISEEEWVIGFSIYLSKENDEKKLRFMFRAYDIKDEGYITRESMFYFLKGCFAMAVVSEEDAEEAPKDLVEIALKKLDFDKDSKVSYGDFAQIVSEEPLLIECLGTCLPQPHVIKKFSTLIAGDKSPWMDKPTNYSKQQIKY